MTGGGVNDVYAAQSLIKTDVLVEVSRPDAEMTPVPDVNPWAAGEFEYGKQRTFDLVVTGNCDFSSSGKLSFTVEPAKKVPDFFTVDKGKIVFAAPQPMCTVRMPKGHSAKVPVRLQNLTSPDSDLANYVWLGLRNKEGVVFEKIQKENVVNIELTDSNYVELVPLISTSASEYAEAEPGADVLSSMNITDKAFNFSSVYRVEIGGEPVVTWEEFQQEEKSLQSIMSVASGGDRSVAVGIVNGEEKMVVASYCNGKAILASSPDGKSWTEECSMVGDGGHIHFTYLTYGKGVWCALKDYCIGYSDEALQKWNYPGIRNMNSIAFHDFFIGVSQSGDVYTSEDGKQWTPNGGTVRTSTENCSICYGGHDEKWTYVEDRGIIYESIDKTGTGTWSKVIDLQNINIDVSEYDTRERFKIKNTYDCCCINGCTYIVLSYGSEFTFYCVIRSKDKKEWEMFKFFGSDNIYSMITVYNNKIYVIGDTKCAVATI